MTNNEKGLTIFFLIVALVTVILLQLANRGCL